MISHVVQNRRTLGALSLAWHQSGFHVKAKNERFTTVDSRCRQNLKTFTSSFGRLRRDISPKSVPHVQHDYFSTFN